MDTENFDNVDGTPGDDLEIMYEGDNYDDDEDDWGSDDPMFDDDWGHDYNEGFYDDDPNPYHGTYSEE